MRIIDMLDSYLMTTEENHPRRSHYASDANACVRQLVYKWRQLPMSDPVTPGDVLKRRMGDAAEALVGKALDWAKGKGLIADWEAQVRREIEVDGLIHPIVIKLDYVVYPAGADQAASEGVEVKSMFGRGIVNIQKTQQPKPDNMVQVLLYMHYGMRPRHTLVYLGRDFGYRTEFDMAYNANEQPTVTVNGVAYPMPPVAHYVSRFQFIESLLQDSGLVPPREYLHAIKDGMLRDMFQERGQKYLSDWQCRYCNWKTRCWEPEVDKHMRGTNSEDFNHRGKLAEEEA